MTDTPKGILALRGKRVTKTVKFLNEDVQVRKLTVSEVKEIQELAKTVEGQEDNDGLDILQKVISLSVVGGEELTADDFAAWPMDELSTLSNTIMKYSGFGEAAPQGKSE
jgi:hypothetical protein